MPPEFCPYCKTAVESRFVYCPFCGKNIKEATSPIPVGKQIGVYVLSLLLPPLGLFPGIKYLLGKNPNGKTVGLIAIVLTIVGAAVTFYFFMQFMDKINEQFEPVLKQYEKMGY